MNRSALTIDTLLRPDKFAENTIYLLVLVAPIDFSVRWSDKKQTAHFIIKISSHYSDVGSSYYAFNRDGQFVVSFEALLGQPRWFKPERITKQTGNADYILKEVHRVYPRPEKPPTVNKTMAKNLSPAFKRQTERLKKAVSNAKVIRKKSGSRKKTITVYNMSWKTALHKGFDLADRGVSNIRIKRKRRAKK